MQTIGKRFSASIFKTAKCPRKALAVIVFIQIAAYGRGENAQHTLLDSGLSTTKEPRQDAARLLVRP